MRTREQAASASARARLPRPGAPQGQATVEFTIIAIVTVIVIIAMVNLFLVSLAWLNAQFAAREGARASVTMVPFAAQDIKDIVDDHFFMSVCSLTGFEASCPEGCCVQVGCCPVAQDAAPVPCPFSDCPGLLESYHPVTVRVFYRVPILIPFIREVLGETIQVIGSATMRRARKEEVEG